MRILIAEDDGNIAEYLKGKLEIEGYQVTHESHGPAVWERGEMDEFDVIVLDLGLPGLDGLSILRRWRKAGVQTPVLVLTARGSWMERVDGFDAGADDYLPKPFRSEELLARLRALLRRARTVKPTQAIGAGRFTIDKAAMCISFDGAPLALTPLEYRLLECLIDRAGEIMTPYELAEKVQGRDDATAKNAVEAIITRLRRKTAPDAIENRRGFGYLLPVAGKGVGP